MKVAVYLVHSFSPQLGGNFSYYNKFISLIDNHDFKAPIEVCFVGRVPASGIKTRKGYVKLLPEFWFKLFNILDNLGLLQAMRRAFGMNIDLCSKSDVRRLKKHGVDVLLFPTQFLKRVNNFPFIPMNWDAGHKTTYAFPEMLENFDWRERWYASKIQKGLAIFVESEAGKKELVSHYTIPEKKIAVIPMFPGGVVDRQVDKQAQEEILHKLGLETHSYFYYPAQYWAHKNHYNLLRGFKELLKRNPSGKTKLVFTGSDQGNKEYVKKSISEFELDAYVKMLGFVSNDEVYTLMRNARSLVMPSFFGPTNMPLVEAQALSTAVICSDLEGHFEMCGEGALYADPLDYEAWGFAMEKMLDDKFRASMVEKGNEIKSKSKFNAESAIRALEEQFNKISSIRKTFN